MSSIKEKIIYAVLSFGAATLAMMPVASFAFQDDSTVSVNVVSNTPVLATPTPLNFGAQYFAVSKVGTTASQIISPTGVLTSTPGAPGAARLIPVNTAAKAPLSFTVTGGVASSLMSLQIGNTAGTAIVTMTGLVTPADATFKVDTWTATASVGTLTTPVNATTGIGQVTLNGTGDATIAFGATLKTDNSGNPYSVQQYDGTIRVQVAY